MFLKGIEIQGFKSFPDRTRIGFDRGITAVVGPNGSGKSNISDAIRWVMGETSVKQLRGGGKMENVIFGGTRKRGAMGYASVQLVLDNTDRRLDVDADEVSIGRKYYRSGESEYSVNGQSVRLKDVYELLLDTGLGRDGYAVIGQGRIAEIVGAKSNERREIFEEASGIARYRYRKTDAERRLASAEENLVRLRDILAELEGRVGPLAKESAKAQKFLELSGEKKAMEVTLWVNTIKETRTALREQQRKIEVAEADYAEKNRALDEIDEQTQGIRHEMEQCIIAVEQGGQRIRELQQQISDGATRVAVLKNEITRNDTDAFSLQDEISAGGDAVGELAVEMATHTEEIERLEEKLRQKREDIAALEEQLEEMQRKSRALGERRGELQASLAGLTDRITALKVSEAAAESAITSATARIAEEQAAAGRIGEDLALLQEQRADTEALLAHTQDEKQKLSNIKNGLELKLQNHTAVLEKAQKAEQELQRAAESAEQRVAMLVDLERNLDGFQASVKTVVKAGREGKLPGIIGPVSSILSVAEGCEVAIETALGYSLQNIVVKNEAAAKAAMSYLKQNNAGRATFLPLDTVKPGSLGGTRLPAGAVSAQTLVRYDAQYENVVSSLLARIVVVDGINDASATARALDYRNRVVTRDGQVINAGGSFTGGSVSRSAGLFSRKQEILDLQAKLAEYAEKQQVAVADTRSAKAEVDALAAELTATGSEIVTLDGERIRCETELSRIVQSAESAQKQAERYTAELEQMAEALAASNAQKKLAGSEQQRLQGEITALSGELAGISDSDDTFLADREVFSQKLGEQRLEALGFERDIELRRQNIETLKSRQGESSARAALLRSNLQNLQLQNTENRRQIEELEEAAVTLRAAIAAVEEDNRAQSALRTQKEQSITQQTAAERRLLDEREALSREVARLSEQRAQLEERCKTTEDELWEEYELTLTNAEPLCVEFDSVTELRRRVTEVRGRIRSLGNVNVGAIEEYEEVNQRYTFLSAQVQDVEQSKAELEKMIAELSAEMTTLFAASFNDINSHFGRIFEELFGGGEAELTLADPENLLESGIDIAVQPPGKVIKDLSALSGGEQALVAICIYFAILAVNPAPFCVLDEIEAALDEVNVSRFAQYLRRITARTQFIVITHRRGSMEEADVLYGVTMQEDGVSKMLRLNVADVDASLVH